MENMKESLRSKRGLIVLRGLQGPPEYILLLVPKDLRSKLSMGILKQTYRVELRFDYQPGLIHVQFWAKTGRKIYLEKAICSYKDRRKILLNVITALM